MEKPTTKKPRKPNPNKGKKNPNMRRDWVYQENYVNEGDNRKYLAHNLEVSALADNGWDRNDPEATQQRVIDYFSVCVKNDMKPSVAGLSLALGIHRTVLWALVHGNTKIVEESRNVLKKAYLILNSQMEDYMQNGKINPVSGIFLMKNNMGYEDKKEINVNPTAELDAGLSQEQLKAKYMGAIESAEKKEIAAATNYEESEE